MLVTAWQGPPTKFAHPRDVGGAGVFAASSWRCGGGRVVSRGYTLLELMIVLAILAAFTALAWPSIQGRLLSVGPKEAGLQFKRDLAEARNQAVQTGEAWAVRVRPGGSGYQLGPVRLLTKLSASQTPNAGGTELDELFSVQGNAEPTGDSLDLDPEPPVGLDALVNPSNGPESVAGDHLANGAGDTQAVAQVRSPGIETLELPAGYVFQHVHSDKVAVANRRVLGVGVAGGAFSSQMQMPGAASSPGARGTADWQAQDAAAFQQDGLAAGWQTADGVERLGQANATPAMGDAASIGDTLGADAWRYFVIYQPDGRATNGMVRIEERTSGSTVEIRVRGFTGAAKMGDVQRRVIRRQSVDPETGEPQDWLTEEDPAGTPMDGGSNDGMNEQLPDSGTSRTGLIPGVESGGL